MGDQLFDFRQTQFRSFQFPILGGTGNPINPDDPSSFSVNPITGDTTASGTVVANNGYLFDPAGADGIPFSGDEPLAPTGYFFTSGSAKKRSLTRISIFPSNEFSTVPEMWALCWVKAVKHSMVEKSRIPILIIKTD